MSQPKDRPSLDERYACAVSTSNLGLPIGDGAGAQGILAAAAWSEVHLGSALRRLRTQWDRERPVKHVPRTRQMLMASGMTREQAGAMHHRERIAFNLTYVQEKKNLRARLPEYQRVLDALTVYAVQHGIEDADTAAAVVLNAWLEDHQNEPGGATEHRLWVYLRECLANAKTALQQAMRGRTANHPG